MNHPVLYAVGAGPGDPRLLTLRAVEVLRSVAVLALPRASEFSESMAWRIVRGFVEGVPSQERVFLTFPMTRDLEIRKAALERALRVLGERLERGLSVAFVTEGDPSLYSTFADLCREVPRRWPRTTLEIVPGVSSVTAVAAVLGVPLADGEERVAILPAGYGAADLEAILQRFDTTVLMKLGPAMPRVVAALERRGWLDRAALVSRATMPEERVVRDLRALREARGDCFATVLVRAGGLAP
jgi:precorrin-2/cobalt-factor-2 C20-methyltransferase